MKPLITIGLPVYNGMPYLPESVDSLLSQTDPNCEILIVDDGSTDESPAYLKSIRDKRVRVIRQENQGLTATLNRMLCEVNTPWLMRHDADDIAYSQRVQRVNEHIRMNPQAGMFYSLADYNSAGKRCGTFRTTQGTPERLRQMVQSGYLLSICHVAVTLNVQKTLDVGGYRFDLYVEDIDLWWRLALHYDLHYIPESLAGIRHNGGSVSSQNLRNQAVNTLYVQYLLMSHLLQRQPRAYNAVRNDLEGMLDRRTLSFRRQMRSANMRISERAWLRAAWHAGGAFLASPRAFIARTSYEISRDQTVQIGEKPEVFAKKDLWDAPAVSGHPELAGLMTR